jgi:hypothetical protein
MQQRINLSAERLRSLLSYDPATGRFVWLRPSKYHAEKAKAEAGCPIPTHSGKAYHAISIDGRKYKRSRLAWLYMTGEWPTHQVDHISGDSLDDRWVNLREATQTQNAWNHKRRAKKSALPMGVRAMKDRFQARIAVNKQMLHLGTFETPEAASAAYRKAREEHYGEFA